MQLNNNQALAVAHTDGAALVLAGPGSGKTAVLTQRIKSLCDKGINPSSILVITFTKAASLEMRQRFDALCKSLMPVCFGTFHSCFFNILKEEKYINNINILSGTKRLSLIKEIVKELNINVDSDEYYEDVARQISIIKNQLSDNIVLNVQDTDKLVPNNTNIKHSAKSTIASALPPALLKLYESEKTALSCIDFDDMLLKAYEMFENRPDILNKWQKRFSYFLIDEAQDMNPLSYRLIRLLSARTNNLFMVGDDDQSIYGFRGADPSILMQFVQDYPNITRIILEVNYRCPANIVDTSVKLINHNINRFVKQITPIKNANDLNIQAFSNEDDEATYLIRQIKAMLNRGIKSDEIAILYRNHNVAHTLISRLVEAHITFNLKEQIPNLYTHWIMQDFEAFFFVALGNITVERLIRVFSRPNQYISRSALPSNAKICSLPSDANKLEYAFSQLLTYYSTSSHMQTRIKDLESHFKRIEKLRPLAAAKYIRKNMGYDQYLLDTASELHIDSKELFKIADLFLDLIKHCNTLKTAINHLYTFRREVDYKNSIISNSDGIALLTLHSSKGLEFNYVFIIASNEGIIPSKKSLTSPSLLEEERRLFYVGMTRSKAHLYLTYRLNNLCDKAVPSRFISEIMEV